MIRATSRYPEDRYIPSWFTTVGARSRMHVRCQGVGQCPRTLVGLTRMRTEYCAANLAGVKRILMVCGGEPLATLGGHLPLDRPMDVLDWP